MRKIIFILFILVNSLFLNAVDIKTSVFAYSYDKKASNKYGYYQDVKMIFKQPNDKFTIAFSQNRIKPKKNFKYVQSISRHEVKTDSVYYHNIWMGEDFYQTFVYDTTFVDTTYTVLDTIPINQSEKSQYGILLDWNHRQFLWYFLGFGIKYTLLKADEHSVSAIFHQDFYKSFNKFNFYYSNSIIASFLKYNENILTVQTDTLDFVYNTTSDSLYLYQPDSVLTFVHYEDSYQTNLSEKKERKLLQMSNRFSIGYSNYSLFLSYDFLIDKQDFNNYFSADLSYISYKYSLDFFISTGQSKFMHTNDFTYFNLENEKLLYSIGGSINFYPLDKRRNFKFGFSYSKYNILKIKGLFFEIGIKL